MPRKPPRPDPPGQAGPPVHLESESTRLTYRELRNTPGRVWERLADDRPLTLVADGEAKAVVIPVRGGDAADAIEAWRRGRALMALGRIQATARTAGRDRTSLEDINRVIRDVRKARRAREEEA